MKAVTLAALALLLIGCDSLPKEQPTILRGRLVLEVEPTPLVVHRVADDLYEVPFAIVMREAGGVDVEIESFTVEAIAFRTMTVKSETHPAVFITSRGYPAAVAAGKYLRFEFVKRWKLPTRLLLSGARLHVIARTKDRDGRRDVSEVTIPVVIGQK